jgi:arginase
MRPVTLIGVPTDIGANRAGTRMGSAALRVAGIKEAVARYGCLVMDGGDVTGPETPWMDPVNGYRHLPELMIWVNNLYKRCYEELQLGHMPLVLGGDHSMAIASISAVSKYCQEQNKKLRVLWFDAHADFNTSALTPTGNIHGMPLAILCGYGPKEATHLSGHSPALYPHEVRQIGIRSVDEGEKKFLLEAGIPVFDMRYIDEIGMRHTLEMALQDIDDNTHIHVSFDVDFLDPQLAPGVGTTVPGGPTYREAQLCMEMIADTGLCSSLDIFELNPALDHRNMTAELVIDLVESLFGKSTLLRVRDSFHHQLR